MKRCINIFKVFILIIVLIIGGTACMKSSIDIKTTLNPTDGVQTSKASSSAGVAESTASSGQTLKRSSPTDDTATKTDKQIVDAINDEIYGYYEQDGVDYSADAMNQAGKLPSRYLGKITSEEDVKAKAEVAWLQTDEKPYVAKYYKEYGVWLVNGTLPSSGVDSSGRKYVVIGGVSYIIIRASDGKVLAVWGDT